MPALIEVKETDKNRLTFLCAWSGVIQHWGDFLGKQRLTREVLPRFPEASGWPD